nr:hypothetical protein [Tanacetum cinerariifolium]
MRNGSEAGRGRLNAGMGRFKSGMGRAGSIKRLYPSSPMFVSSINTGCDSFASHDDNASFSNSLKTPKAVIHHEFIDTHDGLVYWVSRVFPSVLPVLGTVYDSLDEYIEMCRKYASKAAANANIGAVRAHNLYTGLKGSSSLVHGTQTEFKNFTRGVNCFIGDSDAPMLITGMKERKEFTKDFSFDYFVENAELCGLFWADEVAKCNYKEFGDIVQDGFCAFQTIDNSRRSVIVGSGLLKKETSKAYGWLFRAFKKAFVRAPNIVVTDHDVAMRLAVAVKFTESKHRLCMWHIMQKIPFKEFEDRWNKLMEEFNIVNHKWLSKMYRLRSSWIPAFFVDSSLCGLIRTTSRRWTKDLIPLDLMNKKNHYGEKNEAIKKLAMEDYIILYSCVHMLKNNEPKLSVFVKKMKEIKSELEVELPIVPTRIVSDSVQEFIGVKKPDKVKVKNPTGIRPKGREKQKRIKSEREISMKK